jgi:hypothetical protein
MKKREKGFALITVLVFFLVLLILGVGGAIITQMGYFSIASEAKYSVAEKNANKGLMKTLENGNCSNDTSEGIFGGYRVIAVKDDGRNYCFVWSEGRYLGAKVVKTTIFSLKASNWGGAMFRNLNNLSLGGSPGGGNAAIIGYDSPENNCTDPDSCRAPALVTGNQIDPGNVVIACNTNPNNLGRGLVSTVDPYVYDPNLYNKDLTSQLFNAENRTELLEKLSQAFQVSFDDKNDDGRPTGLVNPEIELNVNSCTASVNTIICGSGDNADVFIWDPIKGAYIYTKDNNYYLKIDFGNAQITFNNFLGGGYIAGGNINFVINVTVNSTSSLVLVAKNQIDLSNNNINISNTFMFAKNYSITANNLTVNGGIIYSGGKNGMLTIDLRSGSQLGTQGSPVLIISDNQISISGSGNPDIWGLIFATQNNTYLNTGNGDFKIHGAIISNSLTGNKIDLTGNFEIRFNFATLKKLADNLGNYNLLKTPECGTSRPKNLFTLFTITTY